MKMFLQPVITDMGQQKLEDPGVQNSLDTALYIWAEKFSEILYILWRVLNVSALLFKEPVATES